MLVVPQTLGFLGLKNPPKRNKVKVEGCEFQGRFGEEKHIEVPIEP